MENDDYFLFSIGYTLCKTNMAPEKRPSQTDPKVFQAFRGKLLVLVNLHLDMAYFQPAMLVYWNVLGCPRKLVKG